MRKAYKWNQVAMLYVIMLGKPKKKKKKVEKF